MKKNCIVLFLFPKMFKLAALLRGERSFQYQKKPSVHSLSQKAQERSTGALRILFRYFIEFFGEIFLIDFSACIFEIFFLRIVYCFLVFNSV